MFVVVAIAFPVLLLLVVLGMERVEQRINPPAADAAAAAALPLAPMDTET